MDFFTFRAPCENRSFQTVPLCLPLLSFSHERWKLVILPWVSPWYVWWHSLQLWAHVQTPADRTVGPYFMLHWGQSHNLSGVQLDSFPSCQLNLNCPIVTSSELFSRQISSPVISILGHLKILRRIQSLYKQALTFSSSRYIPLPLTISTFALYSDPLHSFPSFLFFFHLDQGGLVFASESVIAEGEEWFQLLIPAHCLLPGPR